jgi:beta-lactamase class A
MSLLLEDIYRCAETGNGGTLAAVFPNQISQDECRVMIDYLVKNKIAVLLQAGLPEGTRIAHKHGWIIENDGSDAHDWRYRAGLYTGRQLRHHCLHAPPGQQLLFEPANLMVAEISQAVYNFFNLPMDIPASLPPKYPSPIKFRFAGAGVRLMFVG